MKRTEPSGEALKRGFAEELTLDDFQVFELIECETAERGGIIVDPACIHVKINTPHAPPVTSIGFDQGYQSLKLYN